MAVDANWVVKNDRERRRQLLLACQLQVEMSQLYNLNEAHGEFRTRTFHQKESIYTTSTSSGFFRLIKLQTSPPDRVWLPAGVLCLLICLVKSA